MRIEEYQHDLVGDGYRIVSTTDDYNYHSNYYGDPIEMSLTPSHDDSPLCDNLEELIRVAKVEQTAGEDESNFTEIYGDIMRGICPDWQLGEVTVCPDGIILGYGGGSSESPDEGSVYIQGVELALTFKTPRTRLGFNPVYHVLIRHNPDGTHRFTRVDEDLGYMRRTLYFEHRVPNDPNLCSIADDQVVRILEYVGM